MCSVESWPGVTTTSPDTTGWLVIGSFSVIVPLHMLFVSSQMGITYKIMLQLYVCNRRQNFLKGIMSTLNEPWHEIYNNVVCVTSIDSDQPAHMPSLIRAFASGIMSTLNEPWHEIYNNVVCVTSIDSDQPAHMPSLIRAFASHLNII